MAEPDVESILQEIRENVISQHRAAHVAAGTSVRTEAARVGNGVPEVVQPETRNEHNESETARNLSLINSYLTTTARAWDRLPPLLSNRSGFIAGVELWIKRGLKRASHWFTWEQVNFNSAVHHAIRDIVPVLAAQQQELLQLRQQVTDAAARLTEQQAEAAAQLSTLEADLIKERTERTMRDHASEVRWQDADARFHQTVNELRERDERLQDEQRVCFKQLSLETSEASVLEDRARRKTEKLLEELQRRIDQLRNNEPKQ
jgi:hypothetical protein